jgi:hypothetical protein
MALKNIKVVRFLASGVKKLTKFSTKHSNWILALIASLGAVGVAEEFTRATIKAVKLCEEKKPKGAKEIVKTVWKLYLPGVGILLVVVTSVCGNAHINAKRMAAVTSLYAASQTDIKAFKEKAKEILGEGKEKKIEDEVEREKVDKNPPPPEEDIVKTGHGNDLFMIGWTGKYVRANPDFLELIRKQINKEMDEEPDEEIMENRFNELMNLPYCEAGNAIWNKYDMLQEGYKEIQFNITTCKWMEVNGKKEMVSTLRFVPSPVLL